MAARQAARRRVQIGRVQAQARVDVDPVRRRVPLHGQPRRSRAQVQRRVGAERVQVQRQVGLRPVAHQVGQVHVVHAQRESVLGGAGGGQVQAAAGLETRAHRHQAQVGPHALGPGLVAGRSVDVQRSHVHRRRARMQRDAAAAHRQAPEIDDEPGAGRVLGGGRLRRRGGPRMARGQRPRQIGSRLARDHPQLRPLDLQAVDLKRAVQQRQRREAQVERADARDHAAVGVAQHHAPQRQPVAAEPQPVDVQLPGNRAVHLPQRQPPDQVAAARALRERPEAADGQEHDRQHREDHLAGDARRSPHLRTPPRSKSAARTRCRS